MTGLYRCRMRSSFLVKYHHEILLGIKFYVKNTSKAGWFILNIKLFAIPTVHKIEKDRFIQFRTVMPE